jgi:hypothetical protein
MSSMFEGRVRSPVLRHHRIKNDICPECAGSLDTGWECNSCGFDAAPEREWPPRVASGDLSKKDPA